MAGTGKTFLLDAAREAWEERGFTVIGAALAAKAAGGLTKGARISSRTIESLIGRIDWGRDKGQELLDAKTVLVVDEAGMVDTRRMEKLLSETARAGATLILVGDHQQLQPIDAGGPFAALVKNLGAVKLREIIRQREEWMREAVHQFAAGDARGGLSRYAEAGMLDVAESKTEAIERLIATWAEQRSNDLKETLILAGTNADVDALNDLAQAARFRAGELVQDKVCFVGKTRFFAGDRVVFGRNDRTLGVVNGDFGIVEDVVVTPILGRTRLLVRLDREETGKLPFGRRTPAPLRVTVADPAETQLRLAYAVTTHKAQGATVDRSFVLAGGWMQDRELSYVQMSRAREKTWVFTSESDAGEDLCMLTAAMSRTRAKTLASVLVSQPAASRRNDLRLSH